MSSTGRRAVKCLLIASMLGSAACGTTQAYEGGARNRNEVALIQRADVFDNTANIIRVDNVGMGFMKTEMEVLPGHHVVTLEYFTDANFKLQRDVEFTAKAGGLYIAHSTFTGILPTTHWFWIVDSSNHSVVGGAPPPK